MTISFVFLIVGMLWVAIFWCGSLIDQTLVEILAELRKLNSSPASPTKEKEAGL